MQREALPHIMASDPSALNILIEKSASGILALSINTKPSLPMPVCGALHAMDAFVGSGILYNNVFTYI